jgi:hypothetical protein
MVAADMVLNGTTSAKKGGTITTTGYETMQVRDGAKVQAEAGTWNINAKNVSVTANPDNKNDKSSPNRVSNTALSNTLADTNVNIVASPDREEYYSDIAVKNAINKDGDAATPLTLTAVRNISVDADITSAKGKLNILLNADSHKSMGLTNSVRGDGANIIRANIKTNGGDFKTSSIARKDDTGKTYTTNGTYFGLKDSKKAGIERFVSCRTLFNFRNRRKARKIRTVSNARKACNGIPADEGIIIPCHSGKDYFVKTRVFCYHHFSFCKIAAVFGIGN